MLINIVPDAARAVTSMGRIGMMQPDHGAVWAPPLTDPQWVCTLIQSAGVCRSDQSQAVNTLQLNGETVGGPPLNDPQWVGALIQCAGILGPSGPGSLEAQVKHLDVPSAEPISCTATNCSWTSYRSNQLGLRYSLFH